MIICQSSRNFRKYHSIRLLATLLSLALLQAEAVNSQDMNTNNIVSSAESMEMFRTTVKLPDVVLIDQYGHQQEINTLFKKKIVVVDFIFTSCQSICPIITAVMTKIYSLLDGYLGNSVLLISVSVDPLLDNVEVLAEYAEKQGKYPHWLWLTGNPADITLLLKAFGVNLNGSPETHPPIMFVGQQNSWFKWVGLPDARSVANTAIQLNHTIIKVKP